MAWGKKESDQEKDDFTGILSGILKGQSPGSTASALNERMANEVPSRFDERPHVRGYGGTVRKDRSIKVEKFHVPERGQEGK